MWTKNGGGVGEVACGNEYAGGEGRGRKEGEEGGGTEKGEGESIGGESKRRRGRWRKKGVGKRGGCGVWGDVGGGEGGRDTMSVWFKVGRLWC